MMLNLTTQECEGILCTALEGGCDYWMHDYNVRSFKYEGEYRAIFIRPLPGEESPKHPFVDVIAIAKAAETIMSWSEDHPVRKDLIHARGGCDADSADCVVQIAVFGEVVYG